MEERERINKLNDLVRMWYEIPDPIKKVSRKLKKKSKGSK